MSVTSVAGRAGKMASGSRDQTTRTWDLETGKQTGMRKIDRNVVTWIGWRDDNTIVEASEDLNLRIWDIRKKPFKPQVEIKVGTNFATNGDILHDDNSGVYLATGHRGFNNEGAEVKLWDLNNFQAGS